MDCHISLVRGLEHTATAARWAAGVQTVQSFVSKLSFINAELVVKINWDVSTDTSHYYDVLVHCPMHMKLSQAAYEFIMQVAPHLHRCKRNTFLISAHRPETATPWAVVYADARCLWTSVDVD